MFITWMTVVNELEAVLPFPGDVRLRVAARLARQAHVGPLLGHHAVRRAAVDDIGRHYCDGSRRSTAQYKSQ